MPQSVGLLLWRIGSANASLVSPLPIQLSLYIFVLFKIAVGVCFPLAPLLLGQLYTQLDLLHAEELVGLSCHTVATAFNSSVVHTFLWEHALDYITNGRKPYEARNKFATMAAEVAARLGDFQRDVPAVYRWVGCKFYDHSLILSLDNESKVCWRPYGVTRRGFAYDSSDVWVPGCGSSRLHPYF
jgi:hypothetical protein